MYRSCEKPQQLLDESRRLDILLPQRDDLTAHLNGFWDAVSDTQLACVATEDFRPDRRFEPTDVRPHRVKTCKGLTMIASVGGTSSRGRCKVHDGIDIVCLDRMVHKDFSIRVPISNKGRYDRPVQVDLVIQGKLSSTARLTIS
ncbi:hypothetical protein ACQPXM_11365 [Kribbella sp. CA-253562]|uniref:hypothetical protein n=1 Tax=Kribbella sp. CA-253562 TaxID=3239942 RepID=UPI003D8EF279